MTALLRRELQLIARQRAFGAALLAHVLAMTALVMVGFRDSARVMQLVVLALLLPWTAARVVALKRPSAVASKAAAGFLALVLLVASAFPVLLIADRLRGLGIQHALRAEMEPQVLALVAVFLVLVWRRLASDRLFSWIGATATTMLIVAARVAVERM